MHAGRKRYGYIEPTEAAWRLLEQAVEPWLEDISRRAGLGLAEAALRLGLGILQGLQRISDHTRNDDLLLGWAPDFPGETADRVTRALADAGIEATDVELARVAPNLTRAESSLIVAASRARRAQGRASNTRADRC